MHSARNPSYNILIEGAGNYASSGVLTQAVNGPDDLRLIAYTSGSFSDTQQRWYATEKRAFAVYQSVLKFDLHLRSLTTRTIFYMWNENT